MATITPPVPKRGTPAWLDGDLSLRSRRILFGTAAAVSVFALYLHISCKPGDMIDPEFDEGSVCGSLGAGGKYGTPADRWGLVFLVMVCAMCCCPCFSIVDHAEWYETFPWLRDARDRFQRQAQAAINEQRARQGKPPLPVHNPPHTHGGPDGHPSGGLYDQPPQRPQALR